MPVDTEIPTVFPNGEAQLLCCLDGLDTLLHRFFHQKSLTFTREDVPDYLKGMVVTPGQVESAFDKERNTLPENLEQEAVHLAWNKIEQTPLFAVELGIGTLQWLWRDVLQSRFLRLCFLLAAAGEVDQKYRTIFGFLQGNPSETRPTVGLAMQLMSFTQPISLGEAVSALQHSFIWRGLFSERAQGFYTILALRESVLWAILDRPGLPSQLQESGQLLAPHRIVQEPAVIRQDMVSHLARITEASIHNEALLAVYLSGEAGSGRGFIARELLRRSGHFSIWLQLDIEKAQEQELFQELGICCLLGNFIPVLVCQDELSIQQITSPLRTLSTFGLSLVIIIGAEQCTVEKLSEFLVYAYHLGRLDFSQAVAFWHHYVQKLPNHHLDVRALSSRYRLMPGQIVNVVQRGLLEYGQEPMEAEQMGKIIRGALSGQALRHCRRVEPIFTMEDLILPSDVKKQVQRVIDRVHSEDFVQNQWGFEQKYAYGKAIGVLFYGSPGTGKSMCAHVIAKELGLDLLQVDISSIVSKYIGETEKNLSDLFLQAEKTNTILFFDEADALFSKRSTEMSNANDKYANVETAHLLQKMEEYSGICVLTTNMAMNFDKAFFRRFEFIINIPLPDVETREILWRQAFPAQCPVDEDMPFGMLAHALEISPSEIKTIARDAAFMAAMEGGGTVSPQHLQQAVKNDFVKKGKAMPQLFYPV